MDQKIYELTTPAGKTTVDHGCTMARLQTELQLMHAHHVHSRNVRLLTRETAEHATEDELVEYAAQSAERLCKKFPLQPSQRNHAVSTNPR